MVLLGCKPPGRHTEQHDMYFGISDALKDLVNPMQAFWPEAKGEMHVDIWRHVTSVMGYNVKVVPKGTPQKNNKKLYFVNLGGYREDDFEEYHYKQLVVAESTEEAASLARETDFYKQVVTPHIDDHYGVDVDDIFEIMDILPLDCKQTYSLEITTDKSAGNDPLHIGYLKFIDLL